VTLGQWVLLLKMVQTSHPIPAGCHWVYPLQKGEEVFWVIGISAHEPRLIGYNNDDV
jgi:hypothetical protein